MLHARVSDPLGPRWLRSVVPTLSGAMIAVPAFAPGNADVRATVALLGAALFFARRLLRPRLRARDALVGVHPGSIEIGEAGLLDQFVHASDVLAASTARTPAGVALALVRRGSIERPLVLDFASEGDLAAARRALGLGHFGFGEVSWPTRERSASLRGSTVIMLFWLGIAASAALGLTGLGAAIALVAFPATVVALLAACVRDPRGHRVILTAAGARFSDMPAWIPPIRYGEVRSATVDDDGVVLATRGGDICIPMARALPEEREHLAAQILSAAARARGEGPPLPTLPSPLGRLAPQGENARAWLQRLDGAAASIRSAGAYRGGGDLEPKDLWLALENPDAPTRVRAAAARVLARIAPDEARARVPQVLACDRDAHACAVIRGALEEDVDAAARELEALGEPAGGR